jgi:hypothetical protein
MISRRAALQLGAAVGAVGVGGFAAQQAGVLDDGLRTVGMRPHAEPDPTDVTLLRQAAAEQADLLAALDSVSQDDGSAVAELRAVLNEQLAAVSDEPPATSSLGAGGLDFASFAERAEAVAAARADGAMAAGSLAVVKVLATMSAGLEQVAVATRRLA